jgi:arsenate reductase
LKKKILFICTHNSARSQIAEGLLRHKYGDKYEVYSAGTEPTGVNPYAVKVMSEIGIDISSHRSKSVTEFQNMDFDLVVTVCDSAKEVCPVFPGAKKIVHHSFPDPTNFNGSREEKIIFFRNVRTDIEKWIEEYFQ